MPHWKTFSERNFIGAWSLYDQKTGKPREVTVEIARVAGEVLKTAEVPKGKRKLVIRLRGSNGKELPQGFVVNSTNATTIAKMYGDDTDGWIGKKITLYVGSARNPSGGDAVPAVRVRPRVAAGATSELEEVPVDEAMREQQRAAFGGGEREPGQEG